MKPFRTLLAMAMLLVPLAAWAQNSSSPPPMPNLDEMPDGPVIIGQVQTEASPTPKPKVLIQRRILPGGPDTGTFMMQANSEPGMGLGAWWKNSEIVSKLQLSDEQVKKISKTYLDHKLNLIDLQADLEKQELRLQPLMDSDQPDESTVGAQIDLVTAARGKLEKENAMMMLDIRRWLSVEQWKKLKSIEANEVKHNVMYFRSAPGAGIAVPAPPPLPDDMPVRPR